MKLLGFDTVSDVESFMRAKDYSIMGSLELIIYGLSGFEKVILFLTHEEIEYLLTD